MTGEQSSGFSGGFDGQEIGPDTPYFLASATKLFVTAIIIQLVEDKSINLETPIVEFFAPNYLDGLHKLDGKDYTASITVKNLLAHTSGIADYFEQKQADGSVFAREILQGNDISYNIDDVVEMSKSAMTPKFAPGTARKAFYSDTNFQLLGAIIEKSSGVSFAEAVKTKIAAPLGLKNTWRFEADGPRAEQKTIPLRNGKNQLHIPHVMTSTGADGAIVSTAADGLAFITAFFEGKLFSPSLLKTICSDWRRIFFPLQYGTGIMLFQLPPILTMFKKQPQIIGHSGISGAFFYAQPENGIYVSGTVNQLASRSLPYNFLLRAITAMN
ncbi:MAG: beta-lactamase family protein [Devosiaceae bacterium]|nr:beta-lactamase family protein [Devosiaceae bacterium]